MSKKIMFVGDVHGSYRTLSNVFNNIKSANIDAVIQCGDFGYFPNFINNEIPHLEKINVPLYFCDGNHEDHDSLSILNDGDTIYGLPNIFYKKRGSYLEIGNKTVLFVGGASSIDKSVRTPGYDWFYRETISDLDLENLPDKKIDIVVSHTCPEYFLDVVLKRSRTSLKDSDCSRKALNLIFDRYRPDLWIFGHWHNNMDGIFKGTKWRCLDKAGSGKGFYYIATI